MKYAWCAFFAVAGLAAIAQCWWRGGFESGMLALAAFWFGGSARLELIRASRKEKIIEVPIILDGRKVALGTYRCTSELL